MTLSILLLTTSIFGNRITPMISAKPKAPTMAGMRAMPPDISTLPKENRGNAQRPSAPTMATSSPMNPAIQPLTGSLGAVRLPQMMMPKMENQKNSKLLKFSAKVPISGVSVARNSIPMTEPRNDPVVAIPIALPASPCLASGKPSTAVAAFAGVPGMFSRMALRLPP